MKTEQEWKVKEQELNELVKQRRSISKRIHELRVHIAQHKKKVENPPDKTNTLAYQMFGKRYRDLTAEEHKIYYSARQRINRANRKQGIYKRKHKEAHNED